MFLNFNTGKSIINGSNFQSKTHIAVKAVYPIPIAYINLTLFTRKR